MTPSLIEDPTAVSRTRAQVELCEKPGGASFSSSTEPPHRCPHRGDERPHPPPWVNDAGSEPLSIKCLLSCAPLDSVRRLLINTSPAPLNCRLYLHIGGPSDV